MRALRRGTRAAATAAAVAALALAGCETVGQVLKPVAEVGTAIGVNSGAINQSQADAILRTTDAWIKSWEEITPEQEYYLGRAVAATLLHSYQPLDDPELNRYLNLLGQTLAQASDKPETFGGYHFLAIDTDEINAFAAPGGLILISRGMILCCRNEDMLASVLAHEVGHVQYGHGLGSISRSRLTKAVAETLSTAGKEFGTQEVAELTDALEGSIGDITHTLVTSGYSRGAERQADQNTVVILRRVGYDPHQFAAMLREMKKRLKPGGMDFAKTHPDPEDRLIDVEEMLRGVPAQAIPKARQDRFQAFTAKLRGNA
ncbi:MAG: M48 family metalloprotease [Planctomycetes bacterium]|nr:M48 family metalloprotease [Planctomycetota bacterium]